MKVRVADVVREIEEIDPDDPEVAHSTLDFIVERCLPPEVVEAKNKLIAQCPWWGCS